MNTLDHLLERRSEPRNGSQRRATPHLSGVAEAPPSSGQLTDDQAVERDRDLLRTAPPEAIEVAHAEAFAQLTAEQRRLVLKGLSGDLPSQERTDRDDPQSLARMATRTELRRPGTLERTFRGMNASGTGIGLGGFVAADFLSTIAGVVIGSAIADAIFNDRGYEQGYADGSPAEDGPGTDAADAGYNSGDAGFDAGGDFGGGDFGGGEF